MEVKKLRQCRLTESCYCSLNHRGTNGECSLCISSGFTLGIRGLAQQCRDLLAPIGTTDRLLSVLLFLEEAANRFEKLSQQMYPKIWQDLEKSSQAREKQVMDRLKQLQGDAPDYVS